MGTWGEKGEENVHRCDRPIPLQVSKLAWWGVAARECYSDAKDTG